METMMAILTKTEPKENEIGELWGFTDPCEATVIPMTPDEYERWHGVWQCTPAVQWMIEFTDDDDWIWDNFDQGEVEKMTEVEVKVGLYD